MLVEITLNDRAYKYFRETIHTGSQFYEGSSLSHYLLELPIERGKIITFWPDSLIPEKINFEGSVALLKDTNLASMRQIVAKCIYGYLHGSPRRYAIFESWSRKSDPLKPTTPKYLIHDNNLYYMLESSDRVLDEIDRVIRYAREMPFVCSLTSIPKGFHSLQPSRELEEKILQELAARSNMIIIDAYDGEGYLIWYKEGFG